MLVILSLALHGKFVTVVPMSETRANCRNCGEALIGPYCSHCGQHEGRGDFSFVDVAGEVLDELLSWDSRLWRTLVPLVFRPGFLTAEFIAGRRARYVPPFRLYLIISFVLFLVVSLFAGRASIVQTDGDITLRSGLSVSTQSDEAEYTEEADDSFFTVDIAPRRIETAKEGDEVLIPPTVVEDGDGAGEDSNNIDIGISLADEDSPKWLKDLDHRLENNAKSLADDPTKLIQSLVEYLPQMMFLLLPVFALLLKFCYLFSPFHYLQHLVFSLHFHSFLYLLYLLGQLGHFGLQGTAVAEAFPLLILVYLPMALMRSYQSSLAGAAGKALFIIAVDSFLLVMAFAGVALLALALM